MMEQSEQDLGSWDSSQTSHAIHDHMDIFP